jgi:rhodanese-related sulfurtransferase
MASFRNFLLAAAALFCCVASVGAQDAPMQIKGATTIDAKQISPLVTKHANLVIIDSRKIEDYEAGHIKGAIRLIDTDVSVETLAKFLPSKDTPVLFYCNGIKCGRAAKATEKSIQFGYTTVYYYALGMDEWNKLELPLVR